MAFRLKKPASGDPITLTIDKFGRVVIPQRLRDKLGLHPGAKLEVALEDNERIVLRQSQEDPPLIEKDGVVMIGGKWLGDSDIVKLIRDGHEERVQKILNP